MISISMLQTIRNKKRLMKIKMLEQTFTMDNSIILILVQCYFDQFYNLYLNFFTMPVHIQVTEQELIFH